MSSVLFEKVGAVAVLRLNRPEKKNAFNREMALHLQQLLDQCALDAEVRAVYLTGKGNCFSSGQDLAEIIGPQAPQLETLLSETFNPLVRRIRQLPKPILCAVNGVAAGAGANLALCCDVVVAAASATFIQAFSKIGLIPDCGGTFFLPRLVGFQRASALAMLAEPLSALQAENWGMIYRVFEDAVFETESMAMATKLSLLPTRALALTKEALDGSACHSLEEQLQLEDQLQKIAGKTADFQEGIRSFLEKRTPRFRGQ